jgi:hypothetical protein
MIEFLSNKKVFEKIENKNTLSMAITASKYKKKGMKEQTKKK